MDEIQFEKILKIDILITMFAFISIIFLPIICTYFSFNLCSCFMINLNDLNWS
jgi:hypothetical protein